MNDSSSGVTMSMLTQLRNDYGFSPSRALGQNFLIDANIASKIAQYTQDEDASSSVIEVGPGLGSLTIHLARMYEHVHAIEFDQYIIEPLREVLTSFNVEEKVSLINDDVMKVDLDELCTEQNVSTVVGNLPYNISAPLLVNIARTVPSVERVVVMVQKEVAERFCAQQKSRDVSSVTLKTLFFMDIEKLFDVGKNSFYPVPKVESSIMKMTRRKEPIVDINNNDINEFFSLIDLAFSQRRKMLRRSLNSLLGERLNNVFQYANVDPTLRPEQCDLDDFARIFHAMKRGQS